MEKKSVSVVIPCLNEAASIGRCIADAKTGLKKITRIKGEIIVVDNGSTDNSVKIIKKSRVRLVHQKIRGYGSAYKTGIAKARGNIIVIGDSDGTYDFRKIPDFVRQILAGYDLVLGSRFMGGVSGKSMPFFNRIFGNPFLTFLINKFYGCNLTDSQTGYRAFTKNAYRKMHMVSEGMEFASEMIIKAIDNRLNIAEISISYSPRIGRSKLSPFRDALRHIRSILIYSPTYAIIIPGLVLFLTGFIVSAILLPGPLVIGKVMIDVHSLITAVMLTIIGTEMILTGIFVRRYTTEKLHVLGGKLTRFINRHISIAGVFITGIILTFVGLGTMAMIASDWAFGGFGVLSMERIFIVALGLTVIGLQCLFSSILYGLIS